jgi:hypothetical protein
VAPGAGAAGALLKENLTENPLSPDPPVDRFRPGKKILEGAIQIQDPGLTARFPAAALQPGADGPDKFIAVGVIFARPQPAFAQFLPAGPGREGCMARQTRGRTSYTEHFSSIRRGQGS